MIIMDKKGGPLYTLVEKDLETARIALEWISNCPAVILHVPILGQGTLFLFDKDQFDNFAHLYDYDTREHLFAMLDDDEFQKELMRKFEDKYDKFTDELFPMGELEDPDLGDKLWNFLSDRMAGRLHQLGDDSDTRDSDN